MEQVPTENMINGFKAAMRVAYATHDQESIEKMMLAGKKNV